MYMFHPEPELSVILPSVSQRPLAPKISSPQVFSILVPENGDTEQGMNLSLKKIFILPDHIRNLTHFSLSLAHFSLIKKLKKLGTTQIS